MPSTQTPPRDSAGGGTGAPLSVGRTQLTLAWGGSSLPHREVEVCVGLADVGCMMLHPYGGRQIQTSLGRVGEGAPVRQNHRRQIFLQEAKSLGFRQGRRPPGSAVTPPDTSLGRTPPAPLPSGVALKRFLPQLLCRRQRLLLLSVADVKRLRLESAADAGAEQPGSGCQKAKEEFLRR